ncbi:MAG: amidohydrolase family protein [Bdellovibrionaceae bacterium]|nr:amidohydrolase family protein [Pseudobdellovibrionaceae bacterium]MBX3034017.1 amidohydrolase family protein [Pseudobdellovibrionaceae bacterium]
MSRSFPLPLLLGLMMLTSCWSAPKKEDKTADRAAASEDLSFAASENLPVIDVHTHTRFSGKPERTSGIVQTKEQFLREMKESGVVGAVVHTSDNGRTGYNEDMKEHHVVHCLGVEEKVDAARLDQALRSKKYSCLKIYLGYVHRYANDKAYHPVYRLARKHDVPVVFHTGDTYSSRGKLKYSDPLTIDEVAVDFPQVTFVIAHLGNPWIQSATEVAYKNPNVYVEASALLIGDLKKINAAGLERYLIEPVRWAFGYMEDPTKLMYGTDWPLTGMKDYLEAYKRAIPREHWCDVFFNNAVRVFKMKDLAKQHECRVSAR